jgi:hypothetical protein
LLLKIKVSQQLISLGFRALNGTPEFRSPVNAMQGSSNDEEIYELLETVFALSLASKYASNIYAAPFPLL